jgi:peptidyl-prolyl cis-trans isomerase C
MSFHQLPSKPHRPARLALAAALGLALLGASALVPVSALMAQEQKVVARVDGIAITEADLKVAADDLGERLPPGLPEAQRRDYLVGYVVDLKIGARAAEAAKIAENKDFARRLAYFRDKLLLDEWLTAEARKAVTEENARKLFDETVKGMQPEEEVRARHILVESEDEAKKIAARIKGGEDFAKVAGEVSKDPGSGKEGGDLGYFTKERMVPEFANAAFAMKPGEVSAPVKSQFGWHVIKVEDKRAKPLPQFAEVRGEIENYLERKAQQDLILSLRAKAKIERLDQPATPPAAPAPTAPAAPKP